MRSLLVAASILFVAGSAIFFGLRWLNRPTPLESALGRVRVGMTIAEVEAVLGPGTLVDSVPWSGSQPVVRGDVFYRWTATAVYGEEAIVGFKDGAVVDKWYHNLNYP